MKVELLESAGGDLSIVNSARVSFDKWNSGIEDKDARLINYLADHRHDTPFRHNFIQLRCSVPIFIARQLAKHQAGLTWNEVSRRYVDAPPEFYTPKEWRERPDGSIKQGSGDVHKDSAVFSVSYKALLKVAQVTYDLMIDQGVAPEQARMVLPQSMMVDFIWSGNLLAFFHVYDLRSKANAQIEAQEFARLLDEAIAPAFPIGWDALKRRAAKHEA